MKTKMRNLFLAFAMALFSFYSCEKERKQESEIKNQVVFSFDKIVGESANMLKSTTAIEDAAAVIVSILDNTGTMIYNLQEVELYNMNGSFISKPLSLLIGNYSLTQFIVVNAQGDALYISPIAGSQKAYLVNEPLPISFNISKDDVTKLTPEVLDVAQSQPEDFGYSTFSFDVVETFDFLIGVFAYNATSENFEMTNAQLTVETDGAVIYAGEVDAITDTITLNDGYTEYILTVEKDGHETYVDTIANSDLKLFFRSEDNGPLLVVLESEQTNEDILTIITDQSTFQQVNLTLSTIGNIQSEFMINWGDNIVETVSIGSFTNISHEYQSNDIFTIQISGEVAIITYIMANESNITLIDVSSAEGLDILVCNSNQIQNIDLTNNQHLLALQMPDNQLTEIDLSNNLRLGGVILSHNNITSIDISNNLLLQDLRCDSNQISSINISSENVIDYLSIVSNNLNFSTVDQILVTLQESVINTPRGGRIFIEQNAAPSATGLDAKQFLVNTYNWLITND